MIKVKNFFKKNDYLFFTFISGIFILAIIYFIKNITPFGDNSMLKVDFFHQYGPMLAELYDRIHNSESLIYSFNTGLGLPFFRNFFNYMSSIFNIILLFFKRENLLMSYSIIIAMKAIGAATSMSYFLKQKFKFNNNSFIGLSLLYAFSAYFIAYYWNIMWLDGMIFLPLITLGIEKIILENKGILYAVALALMLYSNYFIAYMICIFSVIYFIVFLLLNFKHMEIKKIIFRSIKFAFCSLIAAGLTAWELLPMYNALKSTNAILGTMPTRQYYYFSILEFIKNNVTGVYPTVFATDISNSPNVSCGILSIGFFIIFYLNNAINKKIKITYSIILLILFLSFYIAPLDYIWHGFHVPNDLPYRYSFIYSFILITICGYSLKNISKLSISKVIFSYLICILYLAFIYFSKFENISLKMLKINFLLISIYFIIYIFYKLKSKSLSIFIFIFMICIECILNLNSNWNISHSVKSFYSSYNNIHTKINNINAKDNEPFYRIEKNNLLTLNDGAWYDYYGQTIFSSMAYNSLSKMNFNLGQPGNSINSYYYKENTPIYDMIFDIKYTIGIKKNNYYYTLIDNNDLYKTNKTLGLMFGVNSNIKNWAYNYINPFEYQNSFIEAATNIETVLERVNLEKKNIIYNEVSETIVKFTYKNIQNDFLYFYWNNNLINYIIINNIVYYKNNTNISDIAINTNIPITKYENYDEPYVICELFNDTSFDIYVSFSNYLNEEIDVYKLNNEKLNEAYDLIKDNKIEITKFKEDKIYGQIFLEDRKSIFTSIPYDEGWKVYDNDTEIKTYKIDNALLGFDLDKGDHNLVLKYVPNKLYYGAIISLLTLISSIIYLFLKKGR